MKRRGAAPASLPSDEPSVPASHTPPIANPPSPAARWLALYGHEPPARSAALVAAALAWAEQVAADGDVPPAIQHDLAIVAHQVRVARLNARAGPNGASGAISSGESAASAIADEEDASRAICSADGVSGAVWRNPEMGATHHLAPDGDAEGEVPEEELFSRSSPPLPAPTQPRRRAARAVAPLPTASSQLAVGARLVKVHGGVTHVVDVTADGMRYQGQLFQSLSAVAKHITGTHWNGLLFFGLRRRKVYPAGTRARG